MKPKLTLWCDACTTIHELTANDVELIVYALQGNLADAMQGYDASHPLYKQFHGPNGETAIFCLQAHLADAAEIEAYEEFASSLQEARRTHQGVTYCDQCLQELPTPEGHEGNFEECVEHAPPRDNQVLSDMLSMVSAVAPPAFVATFTDEQYREAETWASLTHLTANDHDDIDVPDRPAFLPPAYPVGPRDNEAMHARLHAAGVDVPLAKLAALNDEAYSAVRWWSHANECSIIIGEGPLDPPRRMIFALGLTDAHETL